MISCALTVSLAPLSCQQFDDAQEAPGCGQVQWTVAHLAAGIDVSAKLEQQLYQLREQQTCEGHVLRERIKSTVWIVTHLFVAVVTGDVQRGEEDGVLDVHEGPVLQEDVCCLTAGEIRKFNFFYSFF